MEEQSAGWSLLFASCLRRLYPTAFLGRPWNWCTSLFRPLQVQQVFCSREQVSSVCCIKREGSTPPERWSLWGPDDDQAADAEDSARWGFPPPAGRPAFQKAPQTQALTWMAGQHQAKTPNTRRHPLLGALPCVRFWGFPTKHSTFLPHSWN